MGLGTPPKKRRPGDILIICLNHLSTFSLISKLPPGCLHNLILSVTTNSSWRGWGLWVQTSSGSASSTAVRYIVHSAAPTCQSISRSIFLSEISRYLNSFAWGSRKQSTDFFHSLFEYEAVSWSSGCPQALVKAGYKWDASINHKRFNESFSSDGEMTIETQSYLVVLSDQSCCQSAWIPIRRIDLQIWDLCQSNRILPDPRVFNIWTWFDTGL